MTTNRLAKPASLNRGKREEDLALAREEAVARGNAQLIELGRDHELHWYIHQDQLCLGWKGGLRTDLAERKAA